MCLLSLIYYLLVVLVVLISVSFYTLYERKVLGLAHARKGPNVVGSGGILQPFSDAIKLFTKEFNIPHLSAYTIYLLSPLLTLALAVASWSIMPLTYGLFQFKYLILVFFILTSLGVYSYLGAGWSSNSSYAMLGSLRCVAQTISYEVSMAFILISALVLSLCFDLVEFGKCQSFISILPLALPLAMAWWLTSVAETNRVPFDFAEGESELVSGFNIEFGSVGFALLFMAEYSSMLLMAMLMTSVFVGGLSAPVWVVSFMIWMFVFIWMRVTLPRSRYDKLMVFSWLVLLPALLGFISGLLSVGWP